MLRPHNIRRVCRGKRLQSIRTQLDDFLPTSHKTHFSSRPTVVDAFVGKTKSFSTQSSLYAKTVPSVDLEQVQEVLSREHEGVHPLDYFFKPKSIVVVGASERQGETGRTILWNLMSCPTIKVYPVNFNNKKTVLGLTAYSTVEDIYEKLTIGTIDLAVVCTPKEQLKAAVQSCIKGGIRAAILVNPDSSKVTRLTEEDTKLYSELKTMARKAGMRILGPDCLGVMTPSMKANGQMTFINASYSGIHAIHGRVAVISQSSEMSTTILDWSLKKNVGFSAFMSTGQMVDVCWGDLIDYFGRDERTDAIILYMENIGSIQNARNFMSAARTAALKKPIIVMKVGRAENSGIVEDESQTTTLVNSDQVLDSIFERCGVLRVDTIEDLFNMSQLLAKQPRPKGNRIAVISNSKSAALIATDSLKGRGELAQLSPKTSATLQKILPTEIESSIPMYLLPNAKPERYIEVMDVLSRDPNIDAILAILTPQELSEPTRTAQLIKQKYSPAVLRKSLNNQPVILTCWMGGVEVEVGRDLLVNAGIPSFLFPDTVLQVFNYMWRYSKNLENLYETSLLQQTVFPSVPTASVQKAKDLMRSVYESGRTVLTELESKQILQIYGIPAAKSILATTADDAVKAAEQIGYPVVLKIHSETLTQKLEVNGVKLNLHDEEAVRRCFDKIKKKTEVLGHPFQGVTVQPMIKQTGNHSTFEVMLGSTFDKQFGPVILFGIGGSYVQIHEDMALAIPPLTPTLARRLINKTKIAKALHGFRQKPGVDLELLQHLIVRFARMAIQLGPYIQSIDINPVKISDAPLLGSDNKGLVAVDAKIVLHKEGVIDYSPAIRRYPAEYITDVQLKNNISAVIRPLRFEDHPLIVDLFGSLSHEQLQQSAKEEALNYESAFYNLKKQQEQVFGTNTAQVPEPLQLQTDSINKQIYNELLQFCIGDYDREMSLGVLVDGRLIAVGRYTLSPVRFDIRQAEIAVLVKQDYQGSGVGKLLLKKLIEVAKREKVDKLIAHIHNENTGMLKLTSKLGFQVQESNRVDFLKTTLYL